MSVGEQLKARREELGLSLREAGKLCNLNHATFSYIENGTRVADTSTLRKIADGLRMDYVRLLMANGDLKSEDLNMKQYEYNSEIYKAKPAVDNPLLDTISKEALVAWFRCNSCYTCAFRKEVVEPHPTMTINRCAYYHRDHHYVDMVEVFGYTKE